MKPTPDLAALVRRQHGAVSRSQLLELGFPQRTVNRLPDRSWEEVHPFVFAAVTSEDDFMRQLWAARLAVGNPCVVSHEAAARLHGFRSFGTAGAVLTAPKGRHLRLAGAFVHQIDDTFNFAEHRAEFDGLPVTTPARTIVDLGAVVRVGRLNFALEDAVSARIVDLDDIGKALYDVARRGKPGMRNVARVLARHQPGRGVPGSQLERNLLRLLRRGGEPEPTLQVPLPGRLLDGLVDCCFEPAKLILEADGRRWHARITQMKKDHERDAAAAQAGYQTLRLLNEHIVGDPEGTLRTVSTTRLVREAQLAA